MAEKNLSCRIEIRLSQTEKDSTQAKAKTLGMTVSNYMRLLLGICEVPHLVTDVAWGSYDRLGQIANALNRATGHISHIVRTTNRSPDLNETHSAEVFDLKNQLSELQSLIQQAIVEIKDVRSQIAGRSSKN